jgi:hypothetical protein
MMRILPKASEIVTVALLSMVAGCSSTPAGERGIASASEGEAELSSIAPDTASRVADALLAAEEAALSQDEPALRRAMLSLERLGAAPQTPTDIGRLEGWFAQTSGPMPPMRGRALGPAYRSGSLRPGAITRIEQTFLGGKSASIVVRVSDGPPLELRVIDQAQREVCEHSASVIQCRWMPLYTQRHRIEIINNRSQVSNYYIVFE